MSEYIFENKDKKQLCELAGDEMKMVIDGVFAGRTELLAGRNWVDKVQHVSVRLTSILRVRKPQATPNQIDWALVPPEYKYLYTPWLGFGMLTTHLHREIRVVDEGLHFIMPEAGVFVWVTEGEYGFKRGTVAPQDSLLIRPIGE